MESTQMKTKKTSLVNQAVWSAVLDAVVVITEIISIIERQITFTKEDYVPVPIPLLISLVSLIILIVTFILSIVKTIDAEKDDELSKINRYKAGYISKYICIVVIIVAICVIKDFSFVFTGDFMDNLSIPIIIFMFEQFVENITFIILEKCNLE